VKNNIPLWGRTPLLEERHIWRERNLISLHLKVKRHFEGYRHSISTSVLCSICLGVAKIPYSWELGVMYF